MAKWCLGMVLWLTFLTSGAQNNYLFNHYMFNPVYVNPAWSGVQREGYIALHHRTQWLGYNTTFDGPGGAPTTQLFSAMIPVSGFISGLGLNLSNDKLGPVNDVQMELAVSFRKSFRNGDLVLGLMPGAMAKTQNFNKLRPNDPEDPLIQGGSETQIQPNMAAGIYYQSGRKFFVGVSAINLPEPSFNFGIDLDSIPFDNRLSRAYSIHSGFSMKVNEDVSLLPSLLVRSDLRGYTYDISAIAVYKSKMWAGLTYRKSESAVLLLGYSLLENNALKVGYSFDYVIRAQAAKQTTSHEIFLRYDLPDLIFGGKKVVKTPRFSF